MKKHIHIAVALALVVTTTALEPITAFAKAYPPGTTQPVTGISNKSLLATPVPISAVIPEKEIAVNVLNQTDGIPTDIIPSLSEDKVGRDVIAYIDHGAIPKYRNTDLVDSSALERFDMVSGGMNVLFDTVIGSKVTARMYIPTTEGRYIDKEVSTLVNASQQDVVNKTIIDTFNKYFTNDIMVITFSQDEDFGMTVKTAVKNQLATTNMSNIYFYSYNRDNNTYDQITDTNHYMDSSNYLHFDSSVGGTIIISTNPLTSK